MLLSFISGAVGGYFSETIEGLLVDPLKDRFLLSDRDMHLIGLAAVLLLAGVVVSLLGVQVRPFWLIVGGVTGVFGTRLLDHSKSVIADRRAKTADKFEDASNAAERANIAQEADEAVEVAKPTQYNADASVEGAANKMRSTKRKPAKPRKTAANKPATPRKKAR